MQCCYRGIIVLKRWAAFFFCWLCWQGNCLAAPHTPTLDVIHVEANTGEAAGGHSAILLGPTVFHYQFFPDQTFLLVRDSWVHFKYVYTELCNRSLRLISLPVTKEIFERLGNHFTTIIVEQQYQFSRLGKITQQQDFVRALADGTDVVMPFVGLFTRNISKDPATMALVRLLEKQLGAGSLEHFAREARQRAGRLLEAAAQQGINEIRRSAELRKAVLEQEFFTLLVNGASLDPKAVVEIPSQPQLLPHEKAHLASYQQVLLNSLVSQMTNHRPGWQESVFLQAARFLAVQRSLSSGRVCTLVPFSSRAVVHAIRTDVNVAPVIARLNREVTESRTVFLQTNTSISLAYTLLESAGGRLNELSQAKHLHHLRTENGILLPSRSGTVVVDWLPDASGYLAAMLTALKAKRTFFQQQIQQKFGYDLATRNCATELVHEIETALAGCPLENIGVDERFLPEGVLSFIPCCMYDRIRQEFPAAEEQLVSSRRLRALAGRYTKGNDLCVWLQESNIFSSTLYRHRIEDSSFIFFTDDMVLLRPVLGAVNLAWGGLTSAVGLLSLPVDNGEQLWQGMRGMVYSLPELVFCTIRKGTYPLADVAIIGP